MIVIGERGRINMKWEDILKQKMSLNSLDDIREMLNEIAYFTVDFTMDRISPSSRAEKKLMPDREGRIEIENGKAVGYLDGPYFNGSKFDIVEVPDLDDKLRKALYESFRDWLRTYMEDEMLNQVNGAYREFVNSDYFRGILKEETRKAFSRRPFKRGIVGEIDQSKNRE